MHHQFLSACFAATVFCCTLPVAFAEDPDYQHPLSAEEREALDQRFRKVVDSTQPPENLKGDAVAVHSRRGDALLFLGEYARAVTEYRSMVTLQPKLDASHWRLGIALYFADQPEAAAEQFDKYHSFDDVDRENGIWRFLCHHRAYGAERAAKELLRYDKDDRQPFPIVYRLFDGSITPKEALEEIPQSLPAAERDKRLFYTNLYVGLLKTVQDDPVAARAALFDATSRKWPRTAGFGPNYMWHVARLQFDELTKIDE
ncbi:MAG: BTAD domain-containing putative transcriptional regulator [Planctomycetaceae bacterium]|jgi:lipoprotein NlpI